MAKGKGFFSELGQFINDLDTFAGAVVNRGLEKAANKIVSDLQEEGPDWTGAFKNNWVIAVGDVDIPATKEDRYEDFPESKGREIPENTPIPKTPTRKISAPPIPGKKSLQKIRYTIGNQMKYRAIAMDLDPGNARWLGSVPPNTAERNWFTTYLQGGQIDKSIAASLGPELDKAWRKR